MTDRVKRKYILKNPKPRKTHQLNTILDDEQYEFLKKYRDEKHPGKKMSSILRELVTDLIRPIEKIITAPRYAGEKIK
jgi:hypothetical protein